MGQLDAGHGALAVHETGDARQRFDVVVAPDTQVARGDTAIGIDRFPERLRMAREHAGAQTIDYTQVDSVPDTLREMTGGRGPDSCIDAVGWRRMAPDRSTPMTG